MNQILLKKIFIRLILILAVISICSLNILRTMHVYNEWENDEVKVKQPFEISILSTGKSDFILIEIDGKFIVIDAATYDYSRKINEYLQLKGVNEIEYLVFTHNDKDHIGSAPVILDNYKVNNLIQADYGKNTVYYENYIEAIDRNNLKPILLHKIIDDDLSGAHITIYPAKEESYNKSNDYSIIVGIEYGKYRFLFAADAEDERMNEFIKAAAENGLSGSYTDRKIQEARFLGLGSPKLDKISNSDKNDIFIPDEWVSVITKADGSYKKIVFYNTTIAAFLANEENSKARYEVTQEVPAVKALAEDESIMASESAKAVAEQSQYAELTPGITEMNSVWEPIDSALQTIATGKSAPKSALDTAVTTIKNTIAAIKR